VRTRDADGFPGVCEVCGSPYLVRYAALPSPEVKTLLRAQRWTMWRYDGWLPLRDGEQPVSLGEGGTPLLKVERIAARQGFDQLWVKDEGTNPTGSFKARGLAAAVTRAALSDILTKLKARGVAVLLCGMVAPPNYGSDYAARFNTIYPDLAKSFGVPLYPFFLEGVVADAKLNQADGMHPTADGVDIVVKNILPTVEAFLGKLSGQRS